MTIKPISPKKIKQTFPDEVIQAFNNLLEAKGNSRSITIYQDTAIDEILRVYKLAGKSITRNQIFDNHWLDVEDTYRKAGWKVEFDKPAYCESYKAYFVFSKK